MQVASAWRMSAAGGNAPRPHDGDDLFKDLPGLCNLEAVWLQITLNEERPSCPGADQTIAVHPGDVLDERGIWRAFRRHDFGAFPSRNGDVRRSAAEPAVYSLVLASAEHLPPGFSSAFSEVGDGDTVALQVVRGEWMLRKPSSAEVQVHVAVVSGLFTDLGSALQPSPQALTEEQQLILNSPELDASSGFLRIVASAGSGKTATLLAIAKAADARNGCRSDRRHIAYAVFNRSMQTEADARFMGTSTDCKTWDAFAHAYVRRHLNHGAAFDVVDDVERCLGGTDRLIWRVVRQFCQSHDSEVLAEHVQQTKEVDTIMAQGMSLEQILQKAIAMYEKSTALDPQTFPIDHAVVFKMCQLDMSRTSRRFTEPPADLLLCDEFQDVNPAQACVARMEAESGLVVVVGDPGQSIYGFRGACRALQDLRGSALGTYHLSKSFRFGAEVATLANSAQALHRGSSLGDFEVLICEGAATEPGCVEFGDFPELRPQPGSSYAVLCMTNRQAITLAMDLLDQEPDANVYFLGEPLRSELALYADLLALREHQHKCTYQSIELRDFDAAGREGRLLKETFKDFLLDRAVGMVTTYGNQLQRVIQADGQKASHKVTFCTVQQAKGLEWDRVVLGHGCNAAWGREIGTWKTSHEAINLLYVALTRARRHLVVPSSLRPLLSGSPAGGRSERAGQILADDAAARRGERGDARRIAGTGEPGVFLVPSQSAAGQAYEVRLRAGSCTCPDFRRRGRACKHVLAAREFASSQGAAV